MTLVIKINDRAGLEQCPVCGDLVELEVGPYLFVVECGYPVHYECGRTEAPLLAAMLVNTPNVKALLSELDELPF